MEFICAHIFSTLVEECGKNVILVMKYDNKENQSYPILNHRYAVKSEKKKIFGKKIQKPRKALKTLDLETNPQVFHNVYNRVSKLFCQRAA